MGSKNIGLSSKNIGGLKGEVVEISSRSAAIQGYANLHVRSNYERCKVVLCFRREVPLFKLFRQIYTILCAGSGEKLGEFHVEVIRFLIGAVSIVNIVSVHNV